jgi:hypothetical protein
LRHLSPSNLSLQERNAGAIDLLGLTESETEEFSKTPSPKHQKRNYAISSIFFHFFIQLYDPIWQRGLAFIQIVVTPKLSPNKHFYCHGMYFTTVQFVRSVQFRLLKVLNFLLKSTIKANNAGRDTEIHVNFADALLTQLRRNSSCSNLSELWKKLKCPL